LKEGGREKSGFRCDGGVRSMPEESGLEVSS
jgi:hypothetical protein